MIARQQVILEERRPELAAVTGEATLHQVVGGTAVASHARAFTLLKASALTPAATAQLLRDMAAHWQRHDSVPALWDHL